MNGSEQGRAGLEVPVEYDQILYPVDRRPSV